MCDMYDISSSGNNIAHTVHIARGSNRFRFPGCEPEELRVGDALCAELKAVVLGQQAGVGVQNPDQCVGLYVELRILGCQGFGKLRRRSLPGLFFQDKGGNLRKLPVPGRPEAACRAVLQDPIHRILPKAEGQLHIPDIPPCAEKLGSVVRPVILEHDEGVVGAAHEAGGAGDHLKGIVGFGLPGVVDGQERDAEAVRNALQPGHSG